MRYHTPMSDDQSPRRPFGERDEAQRKLPLGSQPPARRLPLEDLPPLQLPVVPPPPPPPEEPEPASGQDVPPVVDEPEDAPSLIVVRRKRNRDAARSRLKPAVQAPPPEAEEAQPEVRPQAVIQLGVVVRTAGVLLLIAVISATLFTWWTPNAFLPARSVSQLSVALATQSGAALVPPTEVPALTPTPLAPPTNIGIVSGHRGVHPDSGLSDPGAVCADGLTEQQVNEMVASQVVSLLQGQGYTVDLLDEFDPRLNGYRALAVVSIHADSCEYINELATGFKVASFAESTAPEEDARLVSCLINRYAATTGLEFRPNSITYDMTDYHTFREIAPGTPGAIIEIGFLYLDRDYLTQHPDVVALGIARGIMCYLRNEAPDGGSAPASPPASTP
jgi:N-acetylmuramoyl-L-alanine amidase